MFDRLTKASRGMVNLVNTQSRVDSKTRDILIPRPLRKMLVEVAHQASAEKLSTGYLSELSTRLTGDKIAINALNTSFNKLDEGEFAVVILFSGKEMTSLVPGRHCGWHRLVYSLTDAKFALLCQPVAAMVSISRNMLPGFEILPEAEEAVGSICLCPPDEQTIQDSILKHRAVMIQGCGLFIWDENPYSMLARADLINRLCEINLARH